jgi:hypothetical protein
MPTCPVFKWGKTAVKGKRFLCAKCRKRSPRPVKTPAPWYCPACRKQIDALLPGIEAAEWPERVQARNKIAEGLVAKEGIAATAW